MKVFLIGLITGLFLQIAVGPVFFYLASIALQKTFIDGLMAVFAVTVVDYFYILLAIAGVGKFLENEKPKRIMGIISSFVLMLFGAYMIKGAVNSVHTNIAAVNQMESFISSFISAFILTISSPLTIVFWTGVFAAKAIEYSLTKKELFIFGLSAGLATFLFLGASISLITVFKASIPLVIFQAANLLVGFVLIGYGIIRAVKILSEVKGRL